MNKTTKISNYGNEESLIKLGARLDGIDFDNMSSGNHSFQMDDSKSLFASGVIEHNGKRNYDLTLNVTDAIVFNGVTGEVQDIIFPHVIANMGGDRQRIHVVELIASNIREN